uniref:C2H2-type domain-containing protein n=1 Tax=Ciona savignyi TaxID=51511 RepID=H2YQI9_CIOSA
TCHLCGRAFGQHTNLERHLRKHADKRSRNSDDLFSTKSSLQQDDETSDDCYIPSPSYSDGKNIHNLNRDPPFQGESGILNGNTGFVQASTDDVFSPRRETGRLSSGEMTSAPRPSNRSPHYWAAYRQSNQSDNDADTDFKQSNVQETESMSASDALSNMAKAKKRQASNADKCLDVNPGARLNAENRTISADSTSQNTSLYE